MPKPRLTWTRLRSGSYYAGPSWKVQRAGGGPRRYAWQLLQLQPLLFYELVKHFGTAQDAKDYAARQTIKKPRQKGRVHTPARIRKKRPETT